MSSPSAAPLLNSYWVLPGQLLAGEYPGASEPDSSRERLERLLAAGIDCFVDLTQEQELPAYADFLPAGVRHHRKPIRDHGIPSEPEHMLGILEVIESSLRSGRRVYVHCHAGIGRTGTVIGCLLVEHGLAGDAALEALNRVWRQSARSQVWPSVPETPSQIEYVRSWVRRLGAAEPSDLRSRFRGALVGLAAGDALAVATQSLEPGSFAPVTGPVGGGRFDLHAGAWTDDTAMALCLADSLVDCGGFDPRDQIERYVRWQHEGYLSATGRCVGLTPAAARALAAAQWRRQVFPGSHEPTRLDPEPLARIVPAVMLAFARFEEAIRLAGDVARVTSQAPPVVEACRVFAAMLHAALSGLPKNEVLAARRGLPDLEAAGLRPRLRSLLRGRYRGKSPGQVHTGHTITQALEAALWAFDRTMTFRDGALLAANLGERSDVVTAVYGQLAGAYYAVEAIPPVWRGSLARLDLIEGLADQLFRAATRASAQG